MYHSLSAIVQLVFIHILRFRQRVRTVAGPRFVWGAEVQIISNQQVYLRQTECDEYYYFILLIHNLHLHYDD